MAGHALKPYSAPHHLDQSNRNGKAQTRTAVLAGCGAISLTERLKDELLLLWWDANTGVPDGEVQRETIFVLALLFHSQDDLARPVARNLEAGSWKVPL